MATDSRRRASICSIDAYNELSNVRKRVISAIPAKVKKIKTKDPKGANHQSKRKQGNKKLHGLPLKHASSFGEIELKKMGVWTSMSTEGMFFILTTVNALLINDYGFSYRIASSTLNHVAVSRLFKSNIHRILSLNCIQLF